MLAILLLATSPIAALAQNEPAQGQSAQAAGDSANAESEPSVVRLWPDEPPAWDAPDQDEHDTSGADGRQVAGADVIRLGFVSKPELHVFEPAANRRTGTAVVICPGGGYSILAWDLEGTEIAQWLQRIGVTGIVLKYRVPTSGQEQPWLPPVQDIQRAISLVRAGQVTQQTPQHVGVLGFSAGGNAAVRAATAPKRLYESLDEADQQTAKPDFGVLVYPAWLVEKDDEMKLIDDIQVDESTPPMFFAHARNDRVSCMSSMVLFNELRKQDIAASLHIFASGGHGFGARESGTADDLWPVLCEAWMRDQGWLN